MLGSKYILSVNLVEMSSLVQLLNLVTNIQKKHNWSQNHFLSSGYPKTYIFTECSKYFTTTLLFINKQYICQEVKHKNVFRDQDPSVTQGPGPATYITGPYESFELHDRHSLTFSTRASDGNSVLASFHSQELCPSRRLERILCWRTMIGKLLFNTVPSQTVFHINEL